MKHYHLFPKGISSLGDLEHKQKLFILEADSLLDLDRIKRRLAFSKVIQAEQSKPVDQFMPESVRKALLLEGFSESYLKESAQKIKDNKIKELKDQMEKL